MFRSILVPLDGSSLAEHALPAAAAIAERHGVTLNLAVVHPWGPPENAPLSGTEPDRECRTAESVYLNRMAQAVTATYRVTVCEAVLDGAAGPALAEFARRRGVDLVVASTHGRGRLSQLVLGGVVHHLVHQLRASTLLLKPQTTAIELSPGGGFRRILLATDGSVQAEGAVEPSVALAAPEGATITLLEVITPSARGGSELEHRREGAEQALAELVPRLTKQNAGAETVVVVAANPAAAILTEAHRVDADLIALTTRERHPMEQVIFGSVADAVVHRASVPVLVCHAGS